MPIGHTDVSKGLATIYIEKGRLQYLSLGKEFRTAYNDLEHKKTAGYSSPVPLLGDWGGDVSADETVAFGNDAAPPDIGEIDPTKYLVQSHRAVSLSSELLGRLEGNPEHMLTTVQMKTDLAIESVLDETERQLWDDGFGALCRLTNASPFTTTVATVSPASAAKFFRKGQRIVFAASKTDTLKDSGQALTVASKDPIAGTVTFTENLSEISGIAQNDYMFQRGSAINGGTTRKAIMGFAAWAETPSSGENFLGQDRSLNPAVYAMLQGTGSIGAIQNAIEANAALAYDINGAMIDRVVMNPQDMSLLSQQIGVQTQFAPGTKAAAGYSFLTINGIGGQPITVKCSPYIARNTAYGLTWKSWKLAHLYKTAVGFDENDGQIARKLESSSGIQVRVFSFRQLYSSMPAKNIKITLS